ncbi:hypothetical protein JTF06_05995 [Desemzia sp. RIT804]|uniref:hypothetical protein n=1 Tax=Desemzia sp. RIT 804 TaxID=2810209 RepID=UPI00194F398B|nr:hypothetical protein [Desemzia sp. RIT 804]MBM6614439.1 hypothetical protein [Desemzia sp. RIT 804]
MNLFWSKDVPYIHLFDLHHAFYISSMLLILFVLIHYRKKVRAHSEKIRKSILAVSPAIFYFINLLYR